MSNEIKTFFNEKFGSIRTVILNNDVWFIGKDVASALGFERATKAIQDHVANEDKDVIPIQDSIGRNQNTPIINESGLYSLIFGSRLESAREFKHWVTSEVLPSIRKNGGYIKNQENMTPAEIVANALIVANGIIESQKKEISKQTERANIAEHINKSNKPKVEFYDAVASSDYLMDMNGVAKVLCYKDMGEYNLNKFLRQQKVFDNDNIPYQQYIKAGYFKVIEKRFTNGSYSGINKTTKVYQTGVEYIKKLLDKKGIKKIKDNSCKSKYLELF